MFNHKKLVRKAKQFQKNCNTSRFTGLYQTSFQARICLHLDVFKSNSPIGIMNKSTPFEVKYKNKTAILTVSKDMVECRIGSTVAFSIDTKSIRIVDIPKRQNLLLNWQQGESIKSTSVFSKHVTKIKDAIALAHDQAII